MPDTIRDGSGKGYLAKVNADQQLITRATAVEQRLESAIDHNYFELTTGLITITDAVETPMFYMKNNSATKQIVVDRIFIDTWDSTDGAEDGVIEYYRNPTVVGGTATVPACTDFGSTDVADGTFLVSPTSLTGTEWAKLYLPEQYGLVIEEGRFTLPQGSTFGMSIVPPTGNTSMKININCAFFYINVELIT